MRLPSAVLGSPIDVTWTVKMYNDFCRAVQLIPPPDDPRYGEMADTINTFANISVQIASNYQATEEDLNRVRALVALLYSRSQNEQWKRPEDPILSLCYHLLRHKVINREKAYQWAVQVLGKDKAGDNVDLWRKRVDYFASTRKPQALPPAAKRGRPRKE